MTARPSLCDILATYAARDKNTYGPLYEALLAPKRDTATDVLEIGVYGGGSIAAWDDYYAQARVTGMDIDLGNVRVAGLALRPRVNLVRVNAADRESVERIIGLPRPIYDVVVDDGSHQPEHQYRSLAIFGHYLKNDGIYIIEDILSAYARSLQPELEKLATSMGLTMAWHDRRTPTNDRCDDIMAVFSRT